MRIDINDLDLGDETESFRHNGVYEIKPSREVLIDGIRRDVVVRFTTRLHQAPQIAVDDEVVQASVYLNGALVVSSEVLPLMRQW